MIATPRALFRRLPPPAELLPASRTVAPRPPPSRSSESAAIQPDIITIGMPGPGWAEPPAR